MRKAQVSTEFIFAIGMIILIFLLLFYFTFERRIEITKTERILADKEECYKLSNMITMAYVTQSNHTFKLEKDAIISTNLQSNTDSQSISVGETDYPCTFPVNRVKDPGDHTIELLAGNVEVNYNSATELIEVKNVA